MSKKPENPPAFPYLHESCQRINESEYHGGMTLRDYFAAAALQGLLANSHDEVVNAHADRHRDGAVSFSETAYAIAHEMLKYREETND